MATQVFGTRMLDMLESSLRGLSNKIFGKTQLVLSPDEFIRAFINPEHVETLHKVRELVGFAGLNAVTAKVTDFAGLNFSLQISFHGYPPITLPQYIKHGLQPTCPPELRERIVAWLEERYGLGCAFGDALDALYYLNLTCGDAKAMSLMLPCLPTIMAGVSEDGDNKTVKRARKITAAKSFGKLPALPVTVKQRLIEVSAIVNATSLVDGAPGVTTGKSDAVLAFYSFDDARPFLFGPGNGRFV